MNYSPQEGTQDAIEHYDRLINTIKQIPKHNLLLVLGDFNAHIGKEDANFTYHEKTNSNGQLLLDLALECKMQITNTKFQKKHSKLWTYVSDMTNLKSQVDYILINRKWGANSVKDVCAHNSFASIGSDHRLLRAKIKMSFRTKKTLGQIRHDWALLRGNKDLQQTFTISLQNRLAILCDDNDNIDATQRYEYFIQANKETAENLIPKKKRECKNKTSDDPRIIRAREDVQGAFNTFQHSQTRDHELELQMKKTSLQETYEVVLQEELSNEIERLEEMEHSKKHREAWKSINNISGRKKGKSGILEGKNKEERIKNWHKHFKDLLGREPVIRDEQKEIKTIFENLQYPSGPFTMDELIKARSKITLGKASGPDNIPPEVIKLCSIEQPLLDFANDLLLNGGIPDQWSISNIIPVPKKR